MAMSCDKVEKIGRKICQTFYVHQKITWITPSRAQELSSFSQHLKELAPVISAAGFFNVNQSVLNGIFTTATGYLIMCIQLKSVYT